MAELAVAYVSIVPETSKIAPGVNKALGGVERNVEQRGRSMGGKLMGGLSVAAKGAALGAGAAVAAGFGTALVKGFNRLNAIEQAEAKLSGLGHSADGVAQIMDDALASVKGTAYGLGDAATAAASAVASGIKPGEDLQRNLTLVGDAAAIAGTGFDEMAAIFNKVSASDLIQGEELAQLGDRGIPILQLLGEELGVTAGEVRKMASEGKIDFATFQNAMEAGMGGAAQKSGETFQGAMANVGAAMGRLGAEVLSGVFPKIAPMLGDMIGWLDLLAPAASRAGELLGAGMQRVAEAIGTVSGWVQSTAVPAIQGLWDKFSEGGGAGEALAGVMDRVQSAAATAFGWFQSEGLPALQAVWSFVTGTLVPDLQSAFNGSIGPAMQEVGSVIADAWSGVIRPALEAFWQFVTGTLGPFLVDFYENGVKPTFEGIGAVIEGAWNNVIKPVFDAWVTSGEALSEAAGIMRGEILGFWDELKVGVEAGWIIISGVFDSFKEGLDTLGTAAGMAVDAMGIAWSALVGLITAPISAAASAINSFLNGMQAAVNSVPGVDVGTGTWGSIPTFAAGGPVGVGGAGSPVAMMAAGGRVAGFSPHDRADNIPAWLTAGEYVLPVGAVKSITSKFGSGFLEQMRRGLPGYADGGLVRGYASGGIVDKIKGGINWAVGMFDRGVDWVKEEIIGALPDLGDSWVGQAARGALSLINPSKLLDWLKEKFVGGWGSGRYGGPFGWAPDGGMSSSEIWSIVKGVAPEAVMTSGAREPGSLTASGVPSLHGMGRAIDIVSQDMAATFEKIRNVMPWSQLYYTPMGDRQIGPRDQTVARDHWDHIHIGYADGGRVKPLLFDQGGVLPTGTSLVHNGTGRPEPLARMDGPMEFHLIDADGVLIGTMTGVARHESQRALVGAARKGR